MFHPQNRVASRVSSSKDKGAKLSNLTEAVDHAEVNLRKQILHATFHNLLIDWRLNSRDLEIPRYINLKPYTLISEP